MDFMVRLCWTWRSDDNPVGIVNLRTLAFSEHGVRADPTESLAGHGIHVQVLLRDRTSFGTSTERTIRGMLRARSQSLCSLRDP